MGLLSNIGVCVCVSGELLRRYRYFIWLLETTWHPIRPMQGPAIGDLRTWSLYHIYGPSIRTCLANPMTLKREGAGFRVQWFRGS